MTFILLFLFGIAVGSFLNVVALRYDGEHFVFDPKEIGGRSHCPHCKKTLRWFELIPVVSFVIQGGRCRRCHARIGWQYPLVELLSGIIFVLVPLRLSAAGSDSWIFAALWIVILEILLLLSYIDVRLTIIPDELNVALLILGFFEIWFVAEHFGIGNASFFGPYAALFGLQANIWINHLLAGVFGVLFFGALVLITRGKGMGMGDVKFALPLGILFGWPDILIIMMTSFIIGGIFGVALIAGRWKTIKSAVPFAPFLALASAIAFFSGSLLFNWYFHMIGL